jgi:hypothetical protein
VFNFPTSRNRWMHNLPGVMVMAVNSVKYVADLDKIRRTRV